MQKTLLWKIALIALVALLLEIPVQMIRGLVSERKQARDSVITEIARGSSEAQRIVGPILYVPWTRRSAEATTTTDDNGRSKTTSKEKIERGHVALLPATLSVDGKIDQRGTPGIRATSGSTSKPANVSSMIRIRRAGWPVSKTAAVARAKSSRLASAA
jgi:inner membrane protein involved in colicin E2 resistance